MSSPEPSPARPAEAAPPPRAAAAPRREIGGGAALTLLGTAAGGVLLLLNEWLAARWLGLPGYGLFALAVALAKIGDKLAVLGLHVAALRFVAPAHAEGDVRTLRRVFTACVAPSLAAGLLLSALGAGLAEPLASQLLGKPALAGPLRVALLAVPFFALTEVLGNIARGLGRLGPYVVARHLAPQAVLLVLLLLLVAGAGAGAERPAIADDPRPLLAAAAFVLAGVAAAATATALTWPLARAALGGGAPAGGGPALGAAGPQRPVTQIGVPAVWAYAWPVWANSLLYLLVAWSDLLLLGALAPAEAVGRYRACTQVLIGFDMLSVAFNAACATAFALAAGAPAGSTARQQAWQSALEPALRGLVLLGTVLLALPLLQAEALLRLLGPDFLPAAGSLRLLAGGQFVHAWFSIAAFALVMAGQQRLETRNALVAAALNLSLNLWWIPQWHTLGAAAASALTLCLINLLRVRQLRQVLALRALRPAELRLLLAGLLPAAALSGLWLALAGAVPASAAEALARLGGTAAAALAGLWCLGLDRGERGALRQALAGARPDAPGNIPGGTRIGRTDTDVPAVTTAVSGSSGRPGPRRLP